MILRPGFKGQQSWPGRSGEANLNKLAEDLRGAWLQKGDFSKQMKLRKRSNSKKLSKS
jgi:hypothetical protein